MALRSPPPSGWGSATGGAGGNGSEIARAASSGSGRSRPHHMRLAPDLVTPIGDFPILPSPARNLVAIAGPKGSHACSCSRIHWTRTGLPGIAAARSSGVGGDIIRAIMAVAASAFGMDAAHLVQRHSQHFRERLAQWKTPWRVSPDRHRTVLRFRDGAGWADRAVGQDRDG